MYCGVKNQWNKYICWLLLLRFSLSKGLLFFQRQFNLNLLPKMRSAVSSSVHALPLYYWTRPPWWTFGGCEFYSHSFSGKNALNFSHFTPYIHWLLLFRFSLSKVLLFFQRQFNLNLPPKMRFVVSSQLWNAFRTSGVEETC